MNKSYILGILMVLAAVVGMESCKGGKKAGAKGIVYYRETADPDMLNPINSTSANGRVIQDLIFMGMQGMDPKTYELTNILIAEDAKYTSLEEGEFKGGMKIEFEIRPEAKWDNGTPITGEDYLFTIKSILNPKTNCESLRGYYNWVGDIVVDSANNRKVTCYSKEKYFKIQEFALYRCLPEYIYDSLKIMRKFTVRELVDETKKESLKGNADILQFAESFNSEKFQRDPNYVIGYGPYRLDKWITGQEIVLLRKENWWGDQIKSRDFEASPTKIVIKTIPDNNTAHTALKDNGITVMERIDSKRFKELEANEKVKQNFNLVKNEILTYSYLGFNTRLDKFKDVNVRKAIAMLVDRDQINKVVNNGESTPATTFVHNSQTKVFNSEVKKVEYNLEEAKKMLAAAGWKDADGDGFIDKAGQKMTIDFKIPSGNDITKQLALMLQEQFKKAGIELNISEREWTVFIDEMKKHKFEMNIASWTIPARVSDPYQIWHTESAKEGGSNYVGFGNAESDAIIKQIRASLDENERIELYKKLQKMIYDNQPVIFMFYPKNRMAISKKFTVETHMVDPGFNLNEFKAVDQP